RHLELLDGSSLVELCLELDQRYDPGELLPELRFRPGAAVPEEQHLHALQQLRIELPQAVQKDAYPLSLADLAEEGKPANPGSRRRTLHRPAERCRSPEVLDYVHGALQRPPVVA